MDEDKLLLLLQKKRGFFEAILDLSEDNLHLPVKDLISVLEQKRILLSCIEEIDEELKPYKSSLHTLPQEVTEEIESIREIIEDILDLNEKSMKQKKRKITPDESRRP